MAEAGTPERIEELKHANAALIDGLDAVSVYTARSIDDDSWRLIIEYKLTSEAIAVAADMIFHGNADAHETNSAIITAGLVHALAGSICRACRRVAAAKPVLDDDCAACISVGVDFSETCMGKPCPHWRSRNV